jgi:hypothetical protein
VKPSKIAELERLHDKLNEEFFSGKLMHIRILLESRSRYYDGLYTAHYLKHRPNPDRLHEATITIHTKCWSEPNIVLGTLLHEMIHQYQAEVLGRDCNHDAIFVSIAKRGERIYKTQVR